MTAGRGQRPRLQVWRKETSVAEPGYRRMSSQTDPEDEAHLIIRFAFDPGGLGEGGYGGEPAIAAIGGIWTNEEVVFRFRAAPIRQNNFVQHFCSDRNSGANFIARAESL